MAGIIKTVIRIGVIGGLAAGAAALIAGPERVAALAHQTKSNITSVIDSHIDDPVAMRAQLRDLESKYPRRIAEVRGHLAQINTQREQMDREKSIAARVVELASHDLDQMEDLLSQAETARAEGVSVVRIAFEERTYNLESAYRRAADIADTIELYRVRVTDYDNDLANLVADAQQLEGLLGKLEREHAEFKSQLAHLELQIDAVKRKERMVKVMAERQRKLDELSRYSVANLDQFKAKLAERTAALDAQLAGLARAENEDTYEDQARVLLNREISAKLRYERAVSPEKRDDRDTVEISPGSPNGEKVEKTALLIR